MSKIISEDILYLRYIKRYDSQPQEVRNLLDNFRNFDYQLKVIKRKRPKLKIGDVFLLSPIDNIYFYGKVMKVDIKTIHNDTFVEGMQSVLIHKCKTQSLTLDDYHPKYDDLLIEPAIVDISYWNKGLFYNVGNVPLTDEEKILDYGFYRSSRIRDKFCTEEGETLDHQPRLLGGYGIKTIIGIASEVWEEIIMDPSLLSYHDDDQLASLDFFTTSSSDVKKDYVFIVKNKGNISVCLNIEHDKPFAVGKKINEINEEAYMNGYNWDAFFNYYLPQYAPEISCGKSDPEAGMYVYNYNCIPENEAKAEKFAEIIRSLIEDENELYRIVRDGGADIKWD